MKKHSSIKAIALIIGLVTAPAFAADLSLQILAVNGAPHSGGPVPATAASVIIEVALANWNFGADVILGISMKITLSDGSGAQDLVTVRDWVSDNSGPTKLNAIFDPEFSFFQTTPQTTPHESIDATTANSGCVAANVPLQLWQIELVPTGAQGTLTITAETNADQTSPFDYSVAHAAAGCAAPFLEDIAGGSAAIAVEFSGETTTSLPETTTTPTSIEETTTTSSISQTGGGGGGGGTPTSTSTQPATTTTSAPPETSTTTSSAPPASSSSTSTSIEPPPPGLCAAEELYGAGSEEVALLRALRDEILSASPNGQKLIKLYYTWSPLLAKAIREHQQYRSDVKAIADTIISLVAKGYRPQHNKIKEGGYDE